MPDTALKAELWVYTFKEGLLSAVAHDLRLTCDPPMVQMEAGHILCEVDPSSLSVEGVMRNGQLCPDDLKPKDKRTIFTTIQRDILSVSKHPVINFEGILSEGSVSGSLNLKGARREIKFGVSQSEDGYFGRVEIRPSLWGIKPYRALMGAIKLQDRIIIEFKCRMPS